MGLVVAQSFSYPEAKKAIEVNLKSLNTPAKTLAVPKFYRFTDTTPLFGSIDLSLSKHLEQAELELKILKAIPAPLAQNAKKYLRAILILSEKHKVDPFWILSVMWTESHFYDGAKSNVGARGLMQIMPRTKLYLIEKLHKKDKKLAIEETGFDLSQYFSHLVSDNEYQMHLDKIVNIELGIIYLKKLLLRFQSNPSLATVAYNMGPTWTRRRLNRGLPVGNRNQYLQKVSRAYTHIKNRI